MDKSVEKIVIYSVGLLGGSLGAAFKQGGFTGKVVGLSSPKGIADALKVGAIDEGFGYDEAETVLADADLLLLCSPINTIKKTLEKLATFTLPKGLLISDVGSTKSEIISVAESVLPKHVSFIGGHPMAGSEKSGAAASDPFLFQNAVYVLSESSLTQEGDLQRFGELLKKYTGCRITKLGPKIHDKITATISHVPHLVAVGMVNLATDIEQEIPGTLSLAAGGFKSVTRIASSPYYMWHDIYQTNREATDEILTSYIETMQRLLTELRQERLEESFDSAAEIRSAMATNAKGFVNQLFEILVVAEDRPGFLARMTGLIDQAGLNIRDIELLKVREGDAGTFMLAFQSEDDALQACQILNSDGFSARRI